MSAQLPFHTNSQIIFGTGQRIGASENEREVVQLAARDIFHLWCVGKSGYGKSRFLCSLAVMLLSRGISFTLIDPAGDLSRLLLRQLISLGWYTQPDGFEQVVYLDIPAGLKQEQYLPFNVLNIGFDAYTTADIVLEGWKRAFPSLSGGHTINVEVLVKLCAFVLCTRGLPLFPHMFEMLTDYVYRQSLLAGIEDSFLVQFFASQTNTRTGELELSADATIKRLFLQCFTPLLRHSLGQAENVLDFRRILARGQSVIINLAVGDPDARRLLGSLITVNAEMAAKARGEIPAEQRTGRHMLLLDEFQNFSAQSGEALSHILEECRKYGLFLCLAHQTFAQIPVQLRSALQNVDIRAVFRCERPDAEDAAPLLNMPIDPYLLKPSSTATPRYYSTAEQKELHIQSITQLAKREALLKLPADRLYRLACLEVPDVAVESAYLETVEAEYLRRYFRPPSAIAAATPHQQGFAASSMSPGTVQQREAL